MGDPWMTHGAYVQHSWVTQASNLVGHPSGVYKSLDQPRTSKPRVSISYSKPCHTTSRLDFLLQTKLWKMRRVRKFYTRESLLTPTVSELMTVESRDAAKEAAVHILWVHQGIKDGELGVVNAHGQTSRVRQAAQGTSKYLLHAMFFCENSVDPLLQCGMAGDIWISHPQIYFKSAAGWNNVETEAVSAPRHPFLDRYLTMHPARCAIQWIEKGSIRQHWNKGKWTQNAIESLCHPGIKEVARREPVQAIIGEQWTRLSAHQISLYLSNILPTFLNNQDDTDSAYPPSGALIMCKTHQTPTTLTTP